jgi:hypothetical protein
MFDLALEDSDIDHSSSSSSSSISSSENWPDAILAPKEEIIRIKNASTYAEETHAFRIRDVKRFISSHQKAYGKDLFECRLLYMAMGALSMPIADPLRDLVEKSSLYKMSEVAELTLKALANRGSNVAKTSLKSLKTEKKKKERRIKSLKKAGIVHTPVSSRIHATKSVKASRSLKPTPTHKRKPTPTSKPATPPFPKPEDSEDYIFYSNLFSVGSIWVYDKNNAHRADNLGTRYKDARKRGFQHVSCIVIKESIRPWKSADPKQWARGDIVEHFIARYGVMVEDLYGDKRESLIPPDESFCSLNSLLSKYEKELPEEEV